MLFKTEDSVIGFENLIGRLWHYPFLSVVGEEVSYKTYQALICSTARSCRKCKIQIVDELKHRQSIT
ncbi:set and mynd domain-containing protein 3, partial [Moniliophthora roreri]